LIKKERRRGRNKRRGEVEVREKEKNKEADKGEEAKRIGFRTFRAGVLELFGPRYPK
jgi:hypothetical protein